MASKSDLNIIPAIPAPLGHHSNLVDPPNIDPIVIAFSVLFVLLSTPWVVVRLYTRIWIKPKLWWDDREGTQVQTLDTQLMFLSSDLCPRMGIHGRRWRANHTYTSMGRRTRPLEYIQGRLDAFQISMIRHLLQWNRWLTSFLQEFHDIQIVARIGMCCTKLSFLLFYQRLFVPVGSRWTVLWWSIWVTFWFNILYAAALVITVATECVGKADIVAAGGRCIDEYAMLIFASVVNAISDVMILVIPIVGIWGLQMPTAQKRRLSAVFFIGGLGVIASLARLAYQIDGRYKPNQSIAIMVVCLLKLAEQFIGVSVSCMPILPAFYRHLRSSDTIFQSSMNNNQAGLGPKPLAENHQGFQSRKHGLPSLVSTRKSRFTKNKDPFPIYSMSDDRLTTRGYEELEELERGSEPRKAVKEWEIVESGDHKMNEDDRPALETSHDPQQCIQKDKSVEVTFEDR